MKKASTLPSLNRQSIRLKSYDYSLPGYYFVTICTQNRACLLGEIKNSKMVPSEAGSMVQKIWTELPNYYSGVILDTFVIMPNHLHGIISLNVEAGPCARPMGHPQGGAPTFSLPDVIQRFKSLTSALYRKQVQKNGNYSSLTTLWQRNYYEHVVRRNESLDKIRRYIDENPLKWE